MINQHYLTALSRQALATNLRVLQGFRLGLSDHEHIAKLLDYMKPGSHTTWVDIGCGFGEPAHLMQQLRPDLTFWLVNNNVFQLSQAPEHMVRHCCDMHELPFDNESADGAMFLYSLCHAESFITALREAARVVRPGGRLFVFDYGRTGGDDELSQYHLSSRFMPCSTVQRIAAMSGWEFGEFDFPNGSDAVFRSLFANQDLYDRIFEDLVPIVWWATRR